MHLYSLCQTWLNLKTHTVSAGGGGGGIAPRDQGGRIIECCTSVACCVSFTSGVSSLVHQPGAPPVILGKIL